MYQHVPLYIPVLYHYTCILLLLVATHRSTKPLEANTATNAPPPSLSIQSLPVYTLQGSFRSLKNFSRHSPPKLLTTYFPFSLRWLAEKNNFW